MTRAPFEAAGDGVRLAGWVGGEGTPVLLLHGGPGLSYDYMDDLADDLGDGYLVASYQQRGLAPSSEDGPFSVRHHVDDIGLVLDALGWQQALLLGHSWGGHLALQAATRIEERLLGVLAVDTLGAVGDGGMHEFGNTLRDRTPAEDLERIAELDAGEAEGEHTVEGRLEGLRLLWPAYFASRAAAPPMPDIRMSRTDDQTMASAVAELPALEAALSGVSVPVGFLRGAGSPMPATASTEAADRIPGAWVEDVPDAGHFPWIDVPGSVRAALDRLDRGRETRS